jgi:hypothetical protein
MKLERRKGERAQGRGRFKVERRKAEVEDGRA